MENILKSIYIMQQRKENINKLLELCNPDENHVELENTSFTYSDHLAISCKNYGTFNVLFPKWHVVFYDNYHNKYKIPYKNPVYKKPIKDANTINKTLYKHEGRIDQCVKIILHMIDKGIDIIGLQEMGQEIQNVMVDSKKFYQLIKSKNYEIIYPWNINGYNSVNDSNTQYTNGEKDYQAIIYNKNYIINKNKSIVSYPYTDNNNTKYEKKIMHVCFEENNTKKELHFINTHIQFGQLDRLVNYINNINNIPQGSEVVIVGDFNTEINNNNFYDSIKNNYNIVQCDKSNGYVFENNTIKSKNVKNTHINTQAKKVKYDHIIIIVKK